MNFLDEICKKAKSDVKTIVLPESTDIRTLTAAEEITRLGIAKVILVGNAVDIKNLAGNLDLNNVKIIDPLNDELYDEYVNKFYELRKAKGISIDQARETMKNPLYFGVMLVKENMADGMVAGAIHATSDTLRPALQILKTAPGTSLVSSFFVMQVPDCEMGSNGLFVFADCGLIENPEPVQLSEIAIASAGSFRCLTGEEPRVAMLSYSTYGSAKSEMTEKVITATGLAKSKAPGLAIDGELQADAAIVASVGKQKAPGSNIAGRANVLVFPDLNSGNICYKLVQRLAKAEAYGPITQGLAKPVNDLSRGCIAKDIVGVVAITAIQAQNK